MTGLVVSALLLAPASPIPAGSPQAKTGPVDRFQAQSFARTVYTLADQVAVLYVVEKKDHHRQLIAAAIRGLYEEIGQTVPESVNDAIAKAGGGDARRVALELTEILTDVRMQLGNHPSLSGAKSLFAAINGFKHATDPICGLYSSRVNTYASVDQDFGIGIELEGVVGTRWALYQVEHNVGSGRAGVPGWFGEVPRPETVPSPAGFPWRVRRVVPGSPAQQQGVKPGDIITHHNGTEITAENANRLFSVFAMPPGIDPNTGRPLVPERTLTFRRGEEKPFSLTLKPETYSPESAFGVMRTAEGGWDCMLDNKYKIGYIRLGPIEMGLESKVGEMMDQLARRGCRALILDLRWCPGGYVTPGTAVAGMFLKDGSIIAKMDYRNPNQAGSESEIRSPPGGGTYANLPLVVLVGQETTGGGELIASALRDNDRCVIVGQRTVGRASIQNARPAGFGDVQYRVTTGTSYRPNGQNRQRKADSQPTDDWGIRPDSGLEVPMTADKSAELRRQAELHSLRPADSREALAFDDPDADPHRVAALAYLRKKLGLPVVPK